MNTITRTLAPIGAAFLLLLAGVLTLHPATSSRPSQGLRTAATHEVAPGQVTPGQVTHVDSTVLAAATSADGGGTGASPRPVACVHSATTPAFQVLYAYPRDHGNHLSTGITAIRQAIKLANGIVLKSAQETSSHWQARLRVRCGSAGQIVVQTFAMSKPGDDASGETFGEIADAGRAAGFANGITKYVVFWDSSIRGMCGQAEMHPDDRRVVNNANNLGNSYAVIYGRTCWKGALALHEMAHTMGAVENSAPHATGTEHCNDEQDIMCYPDGGPMGRTSSMTLTCAYVVQFDCHHNDYFHVGRARGYLATHWNLGWIRNRFLAFVYR